MKIGVTGHNGFIGSNVVKTLKLKGHELFLLDEYTRHFDCNDLKYQEFSESLDWVLHFGASTNIEKSFNEPFLVYSNNLNSTIGALRIAKISGAKFLFMSSYVYGKPKYLPIDESHPVNSVNPYMSSKIVSENICTNMSRDLNIPLIVFRAFNIYGDFRIKGRLISDLLDAADGKKDFILNNPLPKRDYLYIKDFLTLIEHVLKKDVKGIGIYNVGFGASYTNLEVCEMVKKFTDSNCKIITGSKKRINDILDCTVNVDLLKNTFSWDPKYPLDKGLKDLIPF